MLRDLVNKIKIEIDNERKEKFIISLIYIIFLKRKFRRNYFKSY